jgi:hypothetical protein
MISLSLKSVLPNQVANMFNDILCSVNISSGRRCEKMSSISGHQYCFSYTNCFLAQRQCKLAVSKEHPVKTRPWLGSINTNKCLDSTPRTHNSTLIARNTLINWLLRFVISTPPLQEFKIVYISKNPPKYVYFNVSSGRCIKSHYYFIMEATIAQSV